MSLPCVSKCKATAFQQKPLLTLMETITGENSHEGKMSFATKNRLCRKRLSFLTATLPAGFEQGGVIKQVKLSFGLVLPRGLEEAEKKGALQAWTCLGLMHWDSFAGEMQGFPSRALTGKLSALAAILRLCLALLRPTLALWAMYFQRINCS